MTKGTFAQVGVKNLKTKVLTDQESEDYWRFVNLAARTWEPRFQSQKTILCMKISVQSRVSRKRTLVTDKLEKKTENQNQDRPW